MLGNAKVEFPQLYPTPGHVEHDLNDIWRSVESAVELAFADLRKVRPDASLNKIECIGITNQRETVGAWSRKTGEPAHRALVWQDRRTAPFCETLRKDKSLQQNIFKKTGLVIDPYFSASKMRWLKENISRVADLERSGDLCFGTIDSYLVFRLTSGDSFAVDHSNASRTQLYNLAHGEYDEDLLKLFGISKNALPEIRASSSFYGKTRGVSFLPDGIPITGVIGDQQSALFGQRCIEQGEGKITYGTGAFILLGSGETPVFSIDGLLTTAAYSDGKRRTFALEGSAFIAGAAVQFLRDHFGWFTQASEAEALALSEPRDPNVVFVPSLTGFGAPYWNAEAKGVLFGLTRGTKKAQIVRAVLESIALQNVQLLKLMESAIGSSISKIGIDGGASANDFLMQFQADMLGVKLIRPKNIQTTSKGAAFAAFLGLNPGASIKIEESSTEFSPKLSSAESKSILGAWKKAADAVDSFYKAD